MRELSVRYADLSWGSRRFCNFLFCEPNREETAKKQPANLLFFRSGYPSRSRISAGELRCPSLILPGKNSGLRPKAGSADRRRYCRTEVVGPGIAAEIGRARAALGEHFGDGALDGRGRRGLTEMVEHHCARPDLADRVGDAAAGDVRRRTVHRLEHRRVVALGVFCAGACETRPSA